MEARIRALRPPEPEGYPSAMRLAEVVESHPEALPVPASGLFRVVGILVARSRIGKETPVTLLPIAILGAIVSIIGWYRVLYGSESGHRRQKP